MHFDLIIDTVAPLGDFEPVFLVGWTLERFNAGQEYCSDIRFIKAKTARIALECYAKSALLDHHMKIPYTTLVGFKVKNNSLNLTPGMYLLIESPAPSGVIRLVKQRSFLAHNNDDDILHLLEIDQGIPATKDALKRDVKPVLKVRPKIPFLM